MNKKFKEDLIMSRNFFKFITVVFFLCILIFPKTAFNGTISGLKLWAVTVLPGLFPAMFLTSVIMAVFPFNNSIKFFYTVISGLLCGFPIGASICSGNYTHDTRNTGEKLMAFCNLSSPSFIINYIYYSILHNYISLFNLLLYIYLPIIYLLFIFYFKNKTYLFSCDRINNNTKSNKKNKKISEIIDNAALESTSNALKLGAYIIIFSVICSYIDTIPFFSLIPKALLCGVLEITNGIFLLSKTSLSDFIKICLILCANSFGGISTIMQTCGIIKNSSLRIYPYILYKLLLTFITFINYICLSVLL